MSFDFHHIPKTIHWILMIIAFIHIVHTVHPPYPHIPSLISTSKDKCGRQREKEERRAEEDGMAAGRGAGIRRRGDG